MFRNRLPATEPDLWESVDGLQDKLHAVLPELRDDASQNYPPLLDEAGIGPALREAADGIAALVCDTAPPPQPGSRAKHAAPVP